ncbi:hypothetical protein Ga0080574_TMP3282 [Salipiger abyssi]|uniref:Uncharacterized protein n=1 Tax=Salipiger abyssi TaxID=1250539 RepID=A0A1P8UW97_9RHOB|nr:hypothetical protein Ga0080574_TMP3282 [Salipiger abyssi]
MRSGCHGREDTKAQYRRAQRPAVVEVLGHSVSCPVGWC